MKFLLRTALLGLVVVPVAALPAAAAEPVFSPDRVHAHVSFLADDLLEGRDTGSRGLAIAQRYVASEMAGYGLQPAGRGADGKPAWLQPVVFSQAALAGPATLTFTGRDGKARVYEQAGDVVIAPSQTEAKTAISAPLVFAGFGLDAKKQGFDDYAGLDVRDKIVVVLTGIPQGPPDEVLAHLGTQKAQMAAAHGAIGLIQIPTLQSLKLRPWDRIKQYAGTPRLTWVAADGKPYVPAPGIRASAFADQAVAEAMFAGARLPLARVQAAADTMHGMPKGFALPGTAAIALESQQKPVQSAEVVGMIPGSDPVLRNEYVVLMAHVDHIGISASRPGDKPDRDRINNGALDNAAGVAVMLEVAHAFASDAVKPKRSLLFVANTAEEKGLLGAEAFANDPSVPIGSIASVVDLDQPLLLYDFTDVIAFGADHSSMGDTIRTALTSAGIALSPDPMPAETIFVRSDHYTFVKRGVPALLLATGYANGGAAAWQHYMATDYHQPSDDLSQPINWQAGAKYARVNYLITRAIADAAERPRWYAGDYFGDTFAPAAPKVARPKVAGR